MAVSIRVLNPFAHVARILVALEEARRVADPRAVERRAAQDRRDRLEEPRLELLDVDEYDLSLVARAADVEQPFDSLAFLSLTRVERRRTDGGDELSDLSLSRPTRRSSDT